MERKKQIMGSYLEEQIYQKMKNEQDAFLAELKTKSKNEIISHAQEITVRENILYLFSEPGRYTQQELNVLLHKRLPLRELYEEWRSRDTDEMETLHAVVGSVLYQEIKQNAAIEKRKDVWER